MAIQSYCDKCKEYTYFILGSDDFFDCQECGKSKRFYCECGNIAIYKADGKMICHTCLESKGRNAKINQ